MIALLKRFSLKKRADSSILDLQNIREPPPGLCMWTEMQTHDGKGSVVPPPEVSALLGGVVASFPTVSFHTRTAESSLKIQLT